MACEWRWPGSLTPWLASCSYVFHCTDNPVFPAPEAAADSPSGGVAGGRLVGTPSPPQHSAARFPHKPSWAAEVRPLEFVGAAAGTLAATCPVCWG